MSEILPDWIMALQDQRIALTRTITHIEGEAQLVLDRALAAEAERDGLKNELAMALARAARDAGEAVIGLRAEVDLLRTTNRDAMRIADEVIARLRGVLGGMLAGVQRMRHSGSTFTLDTAVMNAEAALASTLRVEGETGDSPNSIPCKGEGPCGWCDEEMKL